MFYTKDHFRKLTLDDNTLRIVAEVANEIIEAQGVVLYGNYYQSGRATGFTTTKLRTDSHVCMAIGMIEMGFLETEGKASISRSSGDELADITKKRNALLETENRNLRNKEK
jgi:hypothetical protein